jgi:hypothetical protein
MRGLAGAKKLREELRQECLRKGTELAQAVADALFALPPTEDRDGPIVHLPPHTVRLPREKHVRTSVNLLFVLFAYMVVIRDDAMYKSSVTWDVCFLACCYKSRAQIRTFVCCKVCTRFAKHLILFYFFTMGMNFVLLT